MPAPEYAYLDDDALLFVAQGVDAYGEPRLSPPVEIKCSWSDNETQTTNAQGEMVGLHATADVDRSIPIGSLLWLGTIQDWYGVGSATPRDGLMVVVTSKRTPDIKSRETHRNVGMQRYKEHTPEGT